MMITQQEILNLFDYKDGGLYWKQPRQKVKAGDRAGSINPSTGYELIMVNQKRYKAHRLIFLMFNGYLPKEIDHIDRNKTNNRIENLREATRSQNCVNINMRKDNKSGYRNVNFIKRTKKWFVVMNVNGKKMSFGYYKDLELAGLVAAEARNKYLGLGA